MLWSAERSVRFATVSSSNSCFGDRDASGFSDAIPKPAAASAAKPTTAQATSRARLRRRAGRAPPDTMAWASATMAADAASAARAAASCASSVRIRARDARRSSL